MLTKYDELMCHQLPTTLDHVVSSDPSWTERLWLAVHDKKGRFNFASGIAQYPNRDLMDAYGTITVEDKTQYAVRASRELHPKVDEVKVGPFSYEVVEPMKKVRFVLEETEHDVSFDLLFEATMEAHEEEHQFLRVKGRVKEDVTRFIQVGKPSGWIKVAGERHDVNPEDWATERDHSWGIRLGGGGGNDSQMDVGSARPGVGSGVLYTAAVLQFKDWGVTYHVREGSDGKPWFFTGGYYHPLGSDKEPLRLVSIEHDFEFRPGLRHPKAARIVLHAADGSQKELSIEAQVPYYLGPAGYYLFNDWACGMSKGPSFLDSVKLDLTNPDVRRAVHFLNEQSVVVKCGDEVGYGTIEMMCLGDYPKYGFKGLI